MVFIWGNKGYSDHIGYIIQSCPSCHQAGPFSVYQIRKKFTVYFIPTFSYGSKQAIQCPSCQATFEVPDELKKQIQENLLSQAQVAAIVERAATDRKRRQYEAIRSDLEAAAPKTKACPFCAEQIQAAAVFCRFCNHDLK